jgi:hypothetical protein
MKTRSMLLAVPLTAGVMGFTAKTLDAAIPYSTNSQKFALYEWIKKAYECQERA